MNKNRVYHRSAAMMGAAVWILCSASGVFASDNSATVLPAEGNVVCHDYAANDIILSMDTRSPGASGQVTGPENPADTGASGESAYYTITNGTTLSFSDSTTLVDYAVVKSGRDVSIAMYPAGGVASDDNLTVTVNGNPETISAFSLCYGLGNEPTSPPPPAVTKSCGLRDILDATGIECPTDGSRALVCNFELDADVPLFGTADGSDVCCVCNNNDEPLVECDPNVPSEEANACPDGGAGKLGTEVTTHIELNNDPYYCLTRGGTRTCYPY